MMKLGDDNFYGAYERRGGFLAMEIEAQRARRMFRSRRRRWLVAGFRIALVVLALMVVIWCAWQVRQCGAAWKAAVVEWRWNRAIDRAIPAEDLVAMAPPPIVRREGLPPVAGGTFYTERGPDSHEPADPAYMPH